MLNQQEKHVDLFSQRLLFSSTFVAVTSLRVDLDSDDVSRTSYSNSIASLTNPPQLCLIISSHDSLSVIRIVCEGRVIFTINI